MNNQGIGLMDARPPYITFERRAIERRRSAEDGGASYYVDVDFALVTAQGSKDTTEKIVDEWFPRLQEEARQGRFPGPWLDAYRANYHAWKNDQEPPINGISIKTWPAVSPAEAKMLLTLRVLTVEDLAAANEELLGRIGMGARSLQQRAVDWMRGKDGTGVFVAQIDALRQVIQGLEHRLTATEERARLAEVRASAAPQQFTPQYLSPVEDRLAQAQAALRGPTDDELVADAVGDALRE